MSLTLRYLSDSPVADAEFFDGKSKVFQVGGRTYVVGWAEAVTRKEAQRRCVANGGTLAELYDQKSLDDVV